MEQEEPRYGRRLLNAVIDQRAAAGHERVYASIPRTLDVRDGFRDISYGVLANAINRSAHWLHESVETTPEKPVTITYIGPQDLRYHILSLGAVKSGHVFFFPSPRTAPDALSKLFESADSTFYLYASKPSDALKHVLEERTMRSLEVPSLEHLLDETRVEHIPFNGVYEDLRFKTWVKLHTSGSTNLPKVVPIKFGYVSATDAGHLLPYNEIMVRYGNMRVFTPFPLFHLSGQLFSLITIIWTDSTAILPPTGVPITAELVHDMHTYGRVGHSMLVPSLISELTQNEAWKSGLSKLNSLTFSGGPLSDKTAEIVSKLTPMTSSLGATEFGGIPMLPKDQEDWRYFRFDEAAAGLQFHETDQEGLYELVFHRSNDPISVLVQAIFVTYPELDEYHTKDCFTKHPTKPNLWKYEARIDDIMVLSNGENVNPVQAEGLISSCPIVKGALIVGQGRFQTALLVELRDPKISVTEAGETLSPYIERANLVSKPYARIATDKVIYAKPEKPLPRAGKGTIQRARALQDYKEEIDECYKQDRNLSPPPSKARIRISTGPETTASLLAYLKDEFADKQSPVSPNADFFNLGMDSLQVSSLAQTLNTNRPVSTSYVTPAFIYHHPTAAKLADALTSGKKLKDYSYFDDDDEEEKQTWLGMEGIFQDLRPKGDQSAGSSESIFVRLLRSKEPPPIYQPDGGALAWRQVLASFLINMSNWGLVNSFGVFQTYYATQLLSGYSQSSISWIGTVQGTLLLVVGVISGPIFDKGYFRTMQLVSGIGLVFGIMMLSLATKYYEIMLSQGVLIGICSGLLYIPSIALMPLYFKRYRGLALGIATAGGSFGGVIYPIIFRRLLNQVGFGWATRVIGFVSLVSLLLASILIKPIGPRTTRQLFEVKALTDVPYLTFVVAALLGFSGTLVPFFLVADFGQNAVQMPQELSFYMLAVLNAMQLLGRVIPAFLSDWIGPELLMLAAEFLAGILGFCWIAVDTESSYIGWLIVYGFVSGMIVTLPAVVLPYICPSMATIGTRLGMMYAAAGIGFLISSPVALSVVREPTGFLGAQCWVGACYIAAGVFYAVTAREAHKRRKLYEDNGGGHRLYVLRKQSKDDDSSAMS